MQKFLKWFVFLMFVHGNLIAQVSTPDLDPAVASEMSMAAGWRFDSVIAAGLTQGDSEDKDAQGNKSGTGELTQAIPDIFGAVKLGNLVIEYTLDNEKKWAGDWPDPSSDTLSITSKAAGGALSWLFDGYATLGLGIKEIEQVSESKNTAPTDETLTENIKIIDYGISFRFSQSVFFTYGQKQITREAELVDHLTATTYKLQPLQWTSQIGGAGFIFGGKAGFFRGELGLELSPEVSQASDTTHLAAYQREMTRYFGTAQFLFKNIMISYHRDMKNMSAVQTDVQDQTELVQKYGLGWTLFSQFSLSGYSIIEEIELAEGGSRKNQNLQLKFGFTF